MLAALTFSSSLGFLLSMPAGIVDPGEYCELGSSLLCCSMSASPGHSSERCRWLGGDLWAQSKHTAGMERVECL